MIKSCYICDGSHINNFNVGDLVRETNSVGLPYKSIENNNFIGIVVKKDGSFNNIATNGLIVFFVGNMYRYGICYVRKL